MNTMQEMTLRPGQLRYGDEVLLPSGSAVIVRTTFSTTRDQIKVRWQGGTETTLRTGIRLTVFRNTAA